MNDRRSGVMDVHAWIQANRGAFRDEVLGPVGLEITCADIRHAGFLEQQCYDKMFNFVTRCRCVRSS